MDFPKFIHLISSAQMFFTRADKFADLWEGANSRFTLGLRPQMYLDLSPESRISIFAQMAALKNQMRRETFINCWHENSFESAAMWDLYSRDGNGLAVRTTFSRLQQSLASTPFSIFAGRVTYLDYTSEPVPEYNTMLPFFCKRSSFAHEREARLLVQDGTEPNVIETPEEKHGLVAPVDLGRLIEAVYVAPKSALWIRDTVEIMVKKFGLNIPVKQSNMDSDPVF